MTAITLNLAEDSALARATASEYLLTNGLGGFSMGTLSNIHTRRYHGLLIASALPPVERVLALHSMQATLVIEGSEFPLSSQRFSQQELLHPHGSRYLCEFNQHSPTSASHTWKVDVHGLSITRTLTLEANVNRLFVDFRVQTPPGDGRPATNRTLVLRPFTPLRDFHALHHAHDGSPGMEAVNESLLHLARGTLKLAVNHSGLTFRPDAQWWNTFAYRIERERGQDWLEDVWSPGELQWRLGAQSTQDIRISFELVSPTVETGIQAQSDHHERPTTHSSRAVLRLRDAASQFIVKRTVNKHAYTSILAGYPWFSDWGRDTMISIPGLLIATGRLDEAKSALELFAHHLSPDGLVPNCFDDYDGPPHYNTVDASLWFVHAVHQYVRAVAGMKPANAPDISGLLDACRRIVSAYSRTVPSPSSFNIHLTSEGLISAGDPSTQLTWMDAKRDGEVFTPRHGKAVEINALFHNALMALAEMTQDQQEALRLREHALRTAYAFRTAFWSQEHSCLHDCLSPENEHAPTSLLRGGGRPNQIFAVSLPFSPLTNSQQKAVVQHVTERYLTPFGLRTLDPSDPQFHARYQGTPWERDSAYHQGTVWPWLIGPYCEALLRINNFATSAKTQVRALLAPLLHALD
ncbi:MAG TPA: amylo-alpha-1,6-glucosidase, partial [Phycisphaerales bacterium]|nr:amylo-alpha-1,6-glucosidase [Phycisphaerales bacterium]